MSRRISRGLEEMKAHITAFDADPANRETARRIAEYDAANKSFGKFCGLEEWRIRYQMDRLGIPPPPDELS